MASNEKPRRREGAISQSAGDSTVVLDTRRGTYFTLDDVGTVVWDLCDGTRTLDEIVAAVTTDYEVGADQAETDIRELLDELAAEQLVDGWQRA
jgi:coenzyme PQQ synthesis protein D (PqqD)